MKVPILIVPKQKVPSTAMECPQFTESEAPPISSQVGRVDESHTVKQRLALRLTEKKGHDSEQSQNLLSPHSKGSTDSGYFSRSESADQQISPPNTNAKSYEEIMFGRTWYYRPYRDTYKEQLNANILSNKSQCPSRPKSVSLF
ncbi:hypothetical protein SKAU_G00186290 [Synaphobranchus kaupii]|uniref:Uncharacterized protein n=1 Tax=Synaphobranchus kaupii TaxID=118154 RepID=A0A9Q1FD20_SYNKA|nr:hypothetical protein SKAU_G00186290 [Synaphobranchus kaupii]